MNHGTSVSMSKWASGQATNDQQRQQEPGLGRRKRTLSLSGDDEGKGRERERRGKTLSSPSRIAFVMRSLSGEREGGISQRGNNWPRGFGRGRRKCRVTWIRWQIDHGQHTAQCAGAYGIEHVVSSYSRTEGGFRASLLGREGDYDSTDVLESSRDLEDYSAQSDKRIRII